MQSGRGAVKRRVAMTGASGFIGSYLLETLLARGNEVVCLGRSEETLAAVKGPVVRHVTDFSPEDLTRALDGCSVLIHLAGRRSIRGEDTELTAEFAYIGLAMLDGLLRAALLNGITQVVQASSIAVYSSLNSKPFIEGESAKPASNYGLAKLFSEQYADWWSERHGIPAAHLRIAACYGARERLSSALMSISNQAFNKRLIEVTDGGQHGIDQVYVTDVVRAILRVIDNGGSGPYNIGSGRAASVLEIATTANSVFDNEGNISIAPPENGLYRASIANYMAIDRARNELGWQPEFELRDGLEEMKARWSSLKNE